MAVNGNKIFLIFSKNRLTNTPKCAAVFADNASENGPLFYK